MAAAAPPPPPPPNLGGIGSAEHVAANANGPQRRNSITQSDAIHALVEGGAAGGTVTAAQVAATRAANGHVPTAALMALIPPGTEQNWNPNQGGGRAQIRTGRKWQVPDTAGGRPFNFRIHTNDHAPQVQPGANAHDEAILRVEQGNRTMLNMPMPHPDARIGNVDWVAQLNQPGFANAAHIPVDFPAPMAAIAAPALHVPALLPPLGAPAVGGGAHGHAPPQAAPLNATPPVRQRSCCIVM